ncbi:MAG: hypothetical protein MJA27_04315, partial [Pseudanabaenales cyanobacterium]|nr:hypothetical protein [Pseudanabaenales cyanobacterium]
MNIFIGWEVGCFYGVIAAEPVKAQDSLDASTQDELLWRAIARQLQLQTLPDGWLYSDGHGQF